MILEYPNLHYGCVSWNKEGIMGSCLNAYVYLPTYFGSHRIGRMEILETFTLWTKVSVLLHSSALLMLSHQGVTRRCCLSWLANSALVYVPKFGGRGELRGLSQ